MYSSEEYRLLKKGKEFNTINFYQGIFLSLETSKHLATIQT